ncbi:sorting nexin-2-like isoform X1 [Mytilus galloprovincialis]|uniref:Sorting nexin-2 n=1 Tax=Mytilus galloprovincialis TaxID=29158 RepID=A0A8B6DEG7_MYTGA|nr:sorting nexin-1/2 [Mytilus galloprovincialis]
MADEREPPPMEESNENNEDDIFSEAIEKKTTDESKTEEQPVEDSKQEPTRVPIKADINTDDLFSGEGDEVKLDSEEEEEEEEEEVPEPEPSKKDESNPFNSVEPPKPTEEPTPTPQISVSSHSSSSAVKVTASKPSKEEEEEEDEFTIDIKVSDPQKMGDGMGAYMVYRVRTKTSVPAFRKAELSVLRRFSDFLGLHSKLAEKHVSKGVIVPPAPEKSVIGMTKIKVSKDDSGSSDFIEKRRAALERFLTRTASHPLLRMDPDFRDFLEREGDLPKSTNTSALSGAGVMRLFHKVGDAVDKISFKMDESDEWFDERHQQVENLDVQLRKLHSSMETLVHHRKELSLTTMHFSKSAAMLGNAEEHTALSRALSQLAETEERIEIIQHDQADNDFYQMAELLKDYISLLGSVKEVFHERFKTYKVWKEAEATLTKKRENKAKLELAGKNDKVPQAQNEITEWSEKVEKGKEDFEKISQTIRKEMGRFDRHRVEDFKTTVVRYLEQLMENQQKLIKCWEAFLPEAKAIA